MILLKNCTITALPEERQGAQKKTELCCAVKPKKPSDFDNCDFVLPGTCDGFVQ